DKLEKMFSGEKKQFEFDASKPAGEFTEEEYAFLDNLFTVLQELKETNEADAAFGSMNDISPESAAAVSAYVKKITSRFSDVECPESLDNMDKKLQDAFDSLVENIIVLSQFAKDNPDSSKDSFGMIFSLMIGVAAKAGEAVEPLNNICEERNIDIKSVFGDKYTTEDLSNVLF
ncbi:MAG: hypothetical protein IJR59_06415, partial [Firmicutes bacterium]|nr:hypothetical protein [Bacillota bacterium]